MATLHRWLLPLQKLVGEDLPRVGAKNFSLGELARLGLKTPAGFALTAEAFTNHLEAAGVDLAAITAAERAVCCARVLAAPLGSEALAAIHEAFERLFGDGPGLAARSSLFPFEDDPRHSCAGLFVSRLNLRTADAVAGAVKECFASLLSEAVEAYFVRHGLALRQARMSVGIQRTVDATASATLFTRDPVTLNERLIYIDAADGFGGVTNSALVESDGFFIEKGEPARIVARRKGSKHKRYELCPTGGLTLVPNTAIGFSLSDDILLGIARDARRIEEACGAPQDVELAVARDGQVVYLQARGQLRAASGLTQITVQTDCISPLAVGRTIVFGTASAPLKKHHDTSRNEDAIVVKADLAVRDVPKMYGVKGLLVRHLPPTSHPAIHMREIGVPTLAVGEALPQLAALAGQVVTLDASGERGAVYPGRLGVQREEVPVEEIAIPGAGIYLLTTYPSPTWSSYVRESGIEGIHVRGESVNNDEILIHPLALLAYDAGEMIEPGERFVIERMIAGYPDGASFYVAKFSERLALIRASLRPDQVVALRLTDLQTRDYRHLIAGAGLEEEEENPALGLRGAARLLHPRFRRVLELELAALRGATLRSEGRYRLVVPMVRAPEEMERIRSLMDEFDLRVPLGMMVETPAAVLLAHRFARLADFFCLGVADLTQAINVVDRTHKDLEGLANPACAATRAAVELLFDALRGSGKEVHVPEPFYRFIAGEKQMIGDCRLKVCVWPDRLLRMVRGTKA